jgi:hypothetical protein
VCNFERKERIYMGSARYQVHDCGYGAFDIDDTSRQGKWRPKFLAVVATAHDADTADFICAALNNRECAQNSTQQLKAEIAALTTELSNFSRIDLYEGELHNIVAKMRQLSAV